MQAPGSRVPIGDVSTQVLRELIQRLRQRGVPPAAMSREFAQLRMLFWWLIRQKAIRSNPADILEGPWIQRGRRPAVRPEQFEALRTAARGDVAAAGAEPDRREAQLLADLLEALWLSGLLSIEAIRLQWQDADFVGRHWRIRSPAKMGGDQVLPLPASCLAGWKIKGIRLSLLRRQ